MTDEGKDITLYDVLKAVENVGAETKSVSNRLDSFQREVNERFDSVHKEMSESRNESNEKLDIIQSQMDWLTRQTLANTNDIRNLKQANERG